MPWERKNSMLIMMLIVLDLYHNICSDGNDSLCSTQLTMVYRCFIPLDLSGLQNPLFKTFVLFSSGTSRRRARPKVTASTRDWIGCRTSSPSPKSSAAADKMNEIDRKDVRSFVRSTSKTTTLNELTTICLKLQPPRFDTSSSSSCVRKL